MTQPPQDDEGRRLPAPPPPGAGAGYPPAPGYARPAYGSPPGYGQPPAYGPPPAYGTPGEGPGPGVPRPWQAVPPEELARMHQPGVIPLRPLRLADIFGGALRTMRRNPEATVGLALLVLAVLLVPSLLIGLGVSQSDALAVTDMVGITELVRLLFNGLATLVLSGLIIYVVSEAALGDRVGVGQAWQAVRGRLPALLGVTVLGFLLIFVVVMVLVLAVVALAVALWQSEGVAVVLAVLLVLAAIPLLMWLGVRLSLAAAAVVLEAVGPGRGIARSWALTRGTAGWRILGITVLASIVSGIVSSVVTGPVALFADAGNVAAYTVVNHLADLVVGAFITPFTAGVTALLYLDQRIRREGLDVAMARAAQQRAAARHA